jgi:hypothetical protein
VGSQLVIDALQPEWGQLLTTTQRLVLVLICQSALDSEMDGRPARMYWGGQDFLILRMRGDVPAHGTPEYRTAAEVVRKALRRLEDVGAIRRALTATNGRKAEYEVTVRAPQLPVDNPPET